MKFSNHSIHVVIRAPGPAILTGFCNTGCDGEVNVVNRSLIKTNVSNTPLPAADTLYEFNSVCAGKLQRGINWKLNRLIESVVGALWEGAQSLSVQGYGYFRVCINVITKH